MRRIIGGFLQFLGVIWGGVALVDLLSPILNRISPPWLAPHIPPWWYSFLFGLVAFALYACGKHLASSARHFSSGAV